MPPASGVPIHIRNGDDESAVIRVRLYNARTGRERAAAEPFELAPGEQTTVRFEPTRGDDEAYHLVINGFVALSSDFAGCEIGDLDAPIQDAVEVVVLPNGEPGVCP